jgi:hypothetical protein
VKRLPSRLACSLAALLSLTSAGCSDDADADASVLPSSGSMFGHAEVRVELHVDVGRVTRVTVGGVPAYDLDQTGSTLAMKLQGSPSPGPADVSVEGTLRTLVIPAGYTFEPALIPSGTRWVAFGASYSMGVQSNGIDTHSQLHGVTAQTARVAGAYLGLPLLKPGKVRPYQPSDFGADCSRNASTGDAIGGLIEAFTDPVTKEFSFASGRVDPDLSPRNLAVGGARIRDVVHPAVGQIGILEHIVEAPYSDLGESLKPLEISQLDRIEAIDPDIGISTDLVGNDVLIAVFRDDLEIAMMTPLAQVKTNLDELSARLGQLHGQYFIANLPSLSLVPNVAQIRARRIASGADTAASFDQRIVELDAQVDGYNEAIVAAIGKYPNLHLVDFRAEVENFRKGVVVGGERLTPVPFGGLFSLDHLHLSDTGYALYANVFVRSMNAVLGASVPEVDLEAVHAQDPYRPSALEAAGIRCVPPH